MKTGDLISFIPPVGKTAGRKLLGTVITAPTATGPLQHGSIVTVKGLDGKPYQFDAWLVQWEIVSESANN
jgi:hypothetical protein